MIDNRKKGGRKKRRKKKKRRRKKEKERREGRQEEALRDSWTVDRCWLYTQTRRQTECLGSGLGFSASHCGHWVRKTPLGASCALWGVELGPPSPSTMCQGGDTPECPQTSPNVPWESSLLSSGTPWGTTKTEASQAVRNSILRLQSSNAHQNPK